MTDLDDQSEPMLRARLGRHLTRAAEDVPLRRSPLASIVERAGRRRRRQRVAGTVGAVVVVVGAATIALATNRPAPSIVPSDPGGTITVEGPVASTSAPLDTAPSTTATPAASTPLDAAGLRWTATELGEPTKSILESTADVVSLDTPTLTWTPQFDPTEPSTLYRATDGAAFEEVEPGPGLVVLGGTRTGDRIDVIGYAPLGDGQTLGDVGLTLASRTADEPWMLRAVDLALPEAMAASPFALAEQATIAELDGTIVTTLTIGADGATVTKVFLAPPVGAVIDLSESLVDETVLSSLVTSADGRFVLTTSHRQGTAEDPSAIPPAGLFTSTDGATWQQPTPPPIVLGQVESFGGSRIAAGLVPGGEWLSVERSGRGYDPVDLDEIAGTPPGSWQLVPYGLAVGPDVVAVAANGPVGSSGAASFGVFVSSDLVTWELVDLDDLLGGSYAQLLSIGWVDERLVVRIAVTEPGDPLASTTRLLLADPLP